MKNKIFLLSLGFLLLLTMSVSATVTVNYPVSSSVLTSSAERLQLTMTNTFGGLGNITGVNWSYRSGDTGAWTFLVSNNSNNNYANNYTVWVVNGDFSAVTDGTNYDINATAVNFSGNVESLIVDDVDVDNGNPTVIFATDRDAVKVNSGELAVDCSKSSDAVDPYLNWTIQLLDTSSVLVRTYTTTAATFRDGDFEQVGTYTVQCGVQDSVNLGTANQSFLISSKSQSIEKLVQLSGSKGGGLTQQEFLTGRSSSGKKIIVLLGGALGLVVVISGLYFATKK